MATAAADPDARLSGQIDLDEVARREARAGWRNFWSALGFMSPAIILVGGLLLYPVAFNIYLSLTNWRKFKGFDQFIGLDNYRQLLSDDTFVEATINTIFWVAASLVFPLLLGLGIAVLLRGVRYENVFKNIIFLPRILAPTAVGVIWYFVYAPDGLLNRLLSLFTDKPVTKGWLYDDNSVTPAIIATHVWQTVGLVMILLLLGLAAIPKDPVEAAQMDGASPVQTFWHVVLPLLMPTLVVVSILSVLAGFTTFDLLWVMGSSYPDQRGLSLVVYMYFVAFQKGSWAFGGAVAVIIGAIVLGVTWLQAILQSRAEKMTR